MGAIEPRRDSGPRSFAVMFLASVAALYLLIGFGVYRVIDAVV